MPHIPQGYWIAESIKNKSFEDHYTLGKELGRGSTAKVYKCTLKGTDQAWAVKILDKTIEMKPVAAEIGILLRLDHPNIIRMKEVYETVNYVYIILELVTGSELFERIASEEFYSEEQAGAAVRDIITGVEYLHTHDVVHRDLKPENILCENPSLDSKLKIADFGLSTIVSEKVAMMTVCGTPGYCAPEVLKGVKYFKSCDMWSIGVITYILHLYSRNSLEGFVENIAEAVFGIPEAGKRLCGYEPFYDENQMAMFKKILKGEYTFDSPWWDDVSDNAKDLVRKLLVVDPKKRLTARAALKHVWVTGIANRRTHKEGTVEKIKEFNARRKLKLTTDAVMAIAGATKKMQLLDLLAQNADPDTSKEQEMKGY